MNPEEDLIKLMKNTTLRILGIVLTLAMLSGLLLAAVPVSVSAADLSWSNYTMPQVSVGTSANVFAFSGDGKTIFMWTNGTVNPNITGTSKLYKSTDNGYTWSNSSLDNTTPAIISAATVTITDLAVNPANSNDIIATGIDAGAAHVYRSINAGQTFYPFDPFTVPAGTFFTSLDVANGSSGLVSIVVSYANATISAANSGIAVFDSSVGTWRYTNGTGSADLGTASWGTANGLAAKFSPNYTNDAAIIAVSGNSTNILARGMILATGSTWNAGGGIKDAILKQSGTPIVATATQIASIALPSDFVPTSTVQNRVYVSIGDTLGATTNTDVYRINGSTSTASTAYALATGVNPSSVAYAGTASAGQLAVGQYAGNASFPTGSPVLSTNQVTSNSPTWNSSANSPSGSAANANTQLAFVPGSTATAYTLYAGTAGTNSSLSSSTDLNAFWGVGLETVSAYANVVLGTGTGRGGTEIWQVVRDGLSSNNPAEAMLFYSADSGTTWKCILNNGNNAAISFSRSPAYATDKTIYVTQTDNTTLTASINEAKQIIKTSDGGKTWNLLNTPNNVAAISVVPVDANSYWIASIDRMQLSSSTTYATIEGKTPANGPFTVAAGLMVVATTSGEYYASTDSGVTFNRLGNVNQFGNASPVGSVQAAEKTIYAVDPTTHNILTYTIGKDSAWQTYLNSTQLPAQLQGTTYANASLGSNHPISAISKGSDGFWYIVSMNNYDSAAGVVSVYNPSIWYTSDLLNIQFAALDASKVSDFGGVIPPPIGSGQTLDGNKNTIFYLIINQGTVPNTGIFAATNPSSPNGYPYKVITYTNTLASGVKVTSPDGKSPAGTSVTTSSGTFDQVNFSWVAVSTNNAKYQFQVAYNKDFTSIASTANGNNLNTYNSVGTSSQTNVIDLNFIPSNSVAAVPLSPGQTYYWRARVVAPAVSKWSDPIMFSTVVTSSTSGGIDQAGRISPINGAAAVSVTPAITWGSVPGATGYDFKIATDPAFTSVVDSKTNINTTVYSPSAALKANTTYYWEVRALNGTAAGDWVISAFTTQAVAAPTGAAPTGPAPTTGPAPAGTTVVTVAPQPTPVITVVVPNTPAPAPATPAYIWVIIVIGAVLVIAVIVLIARTRRV
jgi:hypothetical protein